MAFRVHKTNTLGPVLRVDETWTPAKKSASAGVNKKNPSPPRRTTIDSPQELLDIDQLIQRFEHITHGSTTTTSQKNHENVHHGHPPPPRISHRLADLHPANDPIGGEILPLSATKAKNHHDADDSTAGLISSPWDISVVPTTNNKPQYTFPPTSRALATGDVTNDHLPSFRLRDPPPMVRTTSSSSSFHMEVLRPKKSRTTSGSIGSVAIPPAAARPVAASYRTQLSYSVVASHHLPTGKNPKPVYKSFVAPLEESPPPSPSDLQKLEVFNRTIRSLTAQGTAKSAKKAEQLLRSIMTNFEQGVHTVRPDGASYNAVIHAYASRGLPDKAEEILFLMFEDCRHGNNAALPNVRIFTSVLKAWQKANTWESPDRCEKIIEAMNELCTDPRLKVCKPDSYAITALIQSWTESKREGGIAKAEAAFRDMQKKYKDGDKSMAPDCLCYSILMNAYVKERAYKKAEAMLWEMVDDYVDRGNDAAEPRVRNFNSIIALYARSGQLQAPLRAEAIVAQFRELAIQGKLPVSVKPDVYTYSQLLKSWVKSGRVDGIDQAVNCFYWMKELGEAGDDAAAPDKVKYCTIINAYAGTGDYQQARSFLEVMTADYLHGNKNALPDIELYDHVVTACLARADKKHPEAIKAAGAIISELWCLSESIPDLRPTMKMYVGVIHKYVELKDPQPAHSLLMELLMTRRRVVGDPSEQLCRAVIHAWEVSKNASKKSYVFRIRLAMIELKKE